MYFYLLNFYCIKQANNHDAIIKFTAEISDNKISFLDTLVCNGEKKSICNFVCHRCETLLVYLLTRLTKDWPKMALRGSKCVIFGLGYYISYCWVFLFEYYQNGNDARVIFKGMSLYNISSIKKQIPNQLNGNGETRYANEFTCNWHGQHNFTFSPRTTEKLLRKYVQRW